MQQREDSLREALSKNAEETARWKDYKEENDTARENLDRFCKYLTVDVMVPIGRKAYMPGQLIHTNEVLVGHYQSYFSKCSAHKAKEICEHRVKMATEHLGKLQAESDLWQNNLEKPYTEGIFSTPNDREIIEDYDEEKEKVWREKHKLHVKKAKAREKADRDLEAAKGAETAKTEELSDRELFKLLEEAELMEELEKELGSLEDDVSNESIMKFMAGEMKFPPEKLRIAHAPNLDQPKSEGGLIQVVDNNTHNKNVLELRGIVKKPDLDLISVRTNNNHRPNPELAQSNSTHRDESVANEEELPQEVQVIKEQAKFLAVADQIDFYEFQIKIMRQKLLTLPLKTQNDIDQKVYILNVLETLEEMLEIAEDTAEAEEEKDIISDKGAILEVLDEDIVHEADENNGLKQEKQPKRRISFALQNETLEYRMYETVSEMLPKTQPQEIHNKPHERDIVQLDEPVSDSTTNPIESTVKVVDRKQNIIDKVEQNLKYIEENQSTKDFKLVDKILESSLGGCNTLYIQFQHSLSGIEDAKKIGNMETDNVPGSPADLYETYLRNVENQHANKNISKPEQIVFPEAYNGEEKVKVPLLKEADRAQAYKDQRKEFCNLSTDTKSILRNKSAVEREEHKLECKPRATNDKKVPKKKNTAPTDGDEYMSAYYKVMNEVIEKPLTKPEPLPECKYIDAHAPKKRVSRFMQRRRVTENT